MSVNLYSDVFSEAHHRNKLIKVKVSKLICVSSYTGLHDTEKNTSKIDSQNCTSDFTVAL